MHTHLCISLPDAQFWFRQLRPAAYLADLFVFFPEALRQQARQPIASTWPVPRGVAWTQFWSNASDYCSNSCTL